jgi:hypothetical protein
MKTLLNVTQVGLWVVLAALAALVALAAAPLVIENTEWGKRRAGEHLERRAAEEAERAATRAEQAEREAKWAAEEAEREATAPLRETLYYRAAGRNEPRLEFAGTLVFYRAALFYCATQPKFAETMSKHMPTTQRFLKHISATDIENWLDEPRIIGGTAYFAERGAEAVWQSPQGRLYCRAEPGLESDLAAIFADAERRAEAARQAEAERQAEAIARADWAEAQRRDWAEAERQAQADGRPAAEVVWAATWNHIGCEEDPYPLERRGEQVFVRDTLHWETIGPAETLTVGGVTALVIGDDEPDEASWIVDRFFFHQEQDCAAFAATTLGAAMRAERDRQKPARAAKHKENIRRFGEGWWVRVDGACQQTETGGGYLLDIGANIGRPRFFDDLICGIVQPGDRLVCAFAERADCEIDR